MQRINWFPDPNITGTVEPVTGNKAKIDYQVVNNRNCLRVTSTAKGDSYGQYILSGSQLPPASSYHVHANVYARNTQAFFIIYTNVGGVYAVAFSVPVGGGQTVIVDKTITIPAGCNQILVRLRIDDQMVGGIGMMSDILIERADTYDTAAGGGLPGFFTGDTMPRA